MFNRKRLFAAALMLICSSAAMAQSTFVVTNAGDAGPGSLRQAINHSNSNADRSDIRFNINPAVSGPGPWVIRLVSELPAFTAPVSVLGYSQPGAILASFPLNARLMIEISDSALSSAGLPPANRGGAIIFIRGSEGSILSGISFTGGRGGESSAILVMANAVQVRSNWIGIAANGVQSTYSGVAIAAIAADSVNIGGNTSAEGNLIGGTSDNAIMLCGTGHRVRHNWVGFDRNGGSGLANFVRSGILSGKIGYDVTAGEVMYSPAVQQSFFGLRNSTISNNRLSQANDNAIHLAGTSFNPTSGNVIENNIIGRDLFAGSGAWVNVAVRLGAGVGPNRISDNVIGKANSGILLGGALTPTGALMPTIVSAGNGNQLRRNTIVDAFPAIGLNPSTQFSSLANDALDADTGANALQNKPVLSFASNTGGVIGVLNSEPNKPYDIEIFSSASCTFRSANLFLGAVRTNTNSQGNADFTVLLSNLPLGGLRAGDCLVATATEMTLNSINNNVGNSSEISAPIRISQSAQPALNVKRLPSPMPAMSSAVAISATISSASARLPTGEIVFFIRTATRTEELGRATIAAGVASLPTPSAGWFTNAGRFEIVASYEGDLFNLPARSAVAKAVVFRPPSALLGLGGSLPLRLDLARDEHEYFIAPMNTWRRLNVPAGEVYLDAERFNQAKEDSLFFGKSGAYKSADINGTLTSLSSGVIDSNTDVLDLLRLDDDQQADAVVRNLTTNKYGVVRCAFQLDLCESAEDLEVNPEYRYLLSGDFDGDGTSDLVFSDPASGDGRIALMQDGKVIKERNVPLASDERITAAADINGDGFDDLIVLNRSVPELSVLLMENGFVVDVAFAPLPSADIEVPGAIYTAKPGDMDYGVAQLILRDTQTGEAVFWRDPVINGSVLSATPQSLYFDPGLVIKRTR